MPNRFPMPLAAALAVLSGLAIAGDAAGQPATAARTLTIEEAIDIAKQCVLDRNVQVAGSFIESARLERNPRGDRGPYWLVTWAPSRQVKGGQVFVSVFQSRTCELAYGE